MVRHDSMSVDFWTTLRHFYGYESRDEGVDYGEQIKNSHSGRPQKLQAMYTGALANDGVNAVNNVGCTLSQRILYAIDTLLNTQIIDSLTRRFKVYQLSRAFQKKACWRLPKRHDFFGLSSSKTLQ